MKIPHNKIVLTKEQIQKLKRIYVYTTKGIFKEVEKQLGIKEFAARRLVRQHRIDKLKDRYFRYLCNYAVLSGISISEISRRTGLSNFSLCKFRKDNNLELPTLEPYNKRVDDNLEKTFIKEYENGLSAQNIADKYGFKTNKTVLDALLKHDIETRGFGRYTYYDESFFEKIDTHEKAYILGLIMTDGNVLKDYQGFEIQLNEEDGYILEKINDLIGGSKTHLVQKIDCSKRREKWPNTSDMVRLSVYNNKIAEDLRKLGVVKNKTHIMRYVDKPVPDEFLSSYFRGLIDGDGSIYLHNDFPAMTLYCKSTKFISDICSLRDMFTINSNGHCIWLKGTRDSKICHLKWLYEFKGDFYLRRKYEKIKDFID